jgi:hypothetical protein
MLDGAANPISASVAAHAAASSIVAQFSGAIARSRLSMDATN